MTKHWTCDVCQKNKEGITSDMTLSIGLELVDGKQQNLMVDHSLENIDICMNHMNDMDMTQLKNAAWRGIIKYLRDTPKPPSVK